MRSALSALALTLAFASQAYAQSRPTAAPAEGAEAAPEAGKGKPGEKPSAEAAEKFCEENADHQINWFDFFDWKKDNEEQKEACVKAVSERGSYNMRGELDKKRLEAAGVKPQVMVGPPMIAAFINFALLLFLLVRFAGKPISSFLEGRHQTVKRELEESRKRWDEARDRMKEYEAKIEKMERERETLIKQYEEQAQREVERIRIEND